MWDFFIKNNRFAYLFLTALIGVGLYSISSIPRESSPEVVIPIGVVSTVLPGAPAADVESLVTNEIERGLSSLENVKEITSTSRESVSSVIIEFDESADLDKSILDLKDKVDAIKPDLPSDANDPFVSEVNFVDQPILTVAISADLSDLELTDLTSQLEKEIESVTGVSKVEINGVRDREVTVIVDQKSLLRYNLSLLDITQAIRNANLTFPIGQIINEGVSYNIAFDGDITDTSEIADIPISSLGGQPVYVSDIAKVEDALAPASSLSRLSVNGDPSQNSATIDVYKQVGGDITAITKAVNKRVEELKKVDGLLFGITTVPVIDSGDMINKDLLRLGGSGLQTVLLVVILLVFAIGWREGLLAGTAIPLSFMIGFIGLYFSGNTINFLSLFSLILGIGILVDSAIVMVEGINRKMKDNVHINKKEAAIQAIAEFKLPLISGTLTTVSMFVGLFIVSGVTGQFIASIPFTLIFLLFASLFVSLAILPLLASNFLHRRNTTQFEIKQLEYARKLESWYKRHLELYLHDKTKQQKFQALIISLLVFSIFLAINVFAGALAGPFTYLITLKSLQTQDKRSWPNWKRKIIWFPQFILVIVISSLISSTILPSARIVEVVFFEQSDSDYLIVEIEEPEGTTKDVTDISVRRVEEFLYSIPEIDSYSVTVGSGSQWGNGGTGEKFANIFINLDLDRKRTSTDIVTELRKQFSTLKDIDVTIDQPSDGPPTGAPILVKFLGDNLTDLTNLANQTAELFKEQSQTINVRTSTNNNSTEFVLELDKDKAAAVGVSPFLVSQLARTAIYGSDATSITTLVDDIDVVVKLNVSNDNLPTTDTVNRTSINALGDITVPSQVGPVPLSSLVNVSLRESSSVINHQDGKRVVSVEADVIEGANAREVQALLLAEIESNINLPDGVIISTGGGESDESNKAFMEMFLALIVGVGLMVCVLTLQFNSYLHMRYVLSILPYSLIGIFFGLAITGSTLSFPSMMGFIALSGIVVNNSILLIDMMNKLRKEDPSRSIDEVITITAASRLRPILLTTITTVFGMIPLTYAGDLWAPLAYAVMFGLIFSVFITLLLIPITYLNKPGEVRN
ncbi:efflux RND transporter permease subunit [Candidatus Kaiserbacteria bacterium]|nr:efflux RND transporter permease subunit [Candidatus Kaiserbacteria bacterium]